MPAGRPVSSLPAKLSDCLSTQGFLCDTPNISTSWAISSLDVSCLVLSIINLLSTPFLVLSDRLGPQVRFVQVRHVRHASVYDLHASRRRSREGYDLEGLIIIHTMVKSTGPATPTRYHGSRNSAMLRSALAAPGLGTVLH